MTRPFELPDPTPVAPATGRFDARMPPESGPGPRNASEALGFRGGRGGSHAARTMMLTDLGRLFDRTAPDASATAYREAIVLSNDLAKPSRSARVLAHEHLKNLYALDPAVPLFRLLRHLWDREPAARPQLAFAAAVARDPLLRASTPWLLGLPSGETLTRADTESHLAATYPDRFSPGMRAALAQRLNGTWTQAGFLRGRVRKTRVRPVVTPVNLAFNLFLGYLGGSTGDALFKTPWVALLDVSAREEMDALLRSAAHQELLVWRAAASVTELRFPGWLTPRELTWREEMSREQA
jgi:hypothetical protein